MAQLEHNSPISISAGADSLEQVLCLSGSTYIMSLPGCRAVRYPLSCKTSGVAHQVSHCLILHPDGFPVRRHAHTAKKKCAATLLALVRSHFCTWLHPPSSSDTPIIYLLLGYGRSGLRLSRTGDSELTSLAHRIELALHSLPCNHSPTSRICPVGAHFRPRRSVSRCAAARARCPFGIRSNSGTLCLKSATFLLKIEYCSLAHFLIVQWV